MSNAVRSQVIEIWTLLFDMLTRREGHAQGVLPPGLLKWCTPFLGEGHAPGLAGEVAPDCSMSRKIFAGGGCMRLHRKITPTRMGSLARPDVPLPIPTGKTTLKTHAILPYSSNPEQWYRKADQDRLGVDSRRAPPILPRNPSISPVMIFCRRG